MKCLCYLMTPFMFLLVSCEKDDVNTCADGLQLGDRFRLTQEVRLKVVEVIDQYCPCDAVCAFGGFLKVVVEREGGDRSLDTLFGEKQVLIDEYTISLGEVYNRPPCGGITPVEDFCFEIKAE